ARPAARAADLPGRDRRGDAAAVRRQPVPGRLLRGRAGRAGGHARRSAARSRGRVGAASGAADRRCHHFRLPGADAMSLDLRGVDDLLVRSAAGTATRLLVLFSDTGGGHRAAAQAVVDALHAAYPGRFAVEMCDPLRGPGAHLLPRAWAALYGPAIRFVPWLW